MELKLASENALLLSGLPVLEVFPAYTLLCIPLVFAAEHVLILLLWLYVPQEQVKLIITAVVINWLLGASSVLVSGLLAVGLPNAGSAHSL